MEKEDMIDLLEDFIDYLKDKNEDESKEKGELIIVEKADDEPANEEDEKFEKAINSIAKGE